MVWTCLLCRLVCRPCFSGVCRNTGRSLRRIQINNHDNEHGLASYPPRRSSYSLLPGAPRAQDLLPGNKHSSGGDVTPCRPAGEFQRCHAKHHDLRSGVALFCLTIWHCCARKIERHCLDLICVITHQRRSSRAPRTTRHPPAAKPSCSGSVPRRPHSPPASAQSRRPLPRPDCPPLRSNGGPARC